MSDRAAAALLVVGYVAAVPVTLFVPGFLRLWRRRETWAYASAQGGALMLVLGWAAKGNARRPPSTPSGCSGSVPHTPPRVVGAPVRES